MHNSFLFMTENRQFHSFIIINMILIVTHDSAHQPTSGSASLIAPSSRRLAASRCGVCTRSVSWNTSTVRHLALDADTNGSRSLRLEAAEVSSAVGLIEGDEVVRGRDPRARELARVLQLVGEQPCDFPH